MRLRGTRARAVAGFLAAGLMLTACGSGEEAAAGDDVFDFVAVVPVSGPLSDQGGIPARQALETGIEILNADGGIDGRKIKLTVIDTAGDAAKGVANLQAHLADNDKPDAVFAGQYSFEALPLAPILTQAEILSVTSSITPQLDDPKKFPYTFQQSVPIATIINVLADHIAGKGYKTVGYAATDDESGHSAVESFEKVAAGKGLTVVPAYVPSDSVDATAVLEGLRAKKPDVLVLNAVGPAAANLLKSRTEIGWDIPTIGEGAGFASMDLGTISDPAYWKNVTVQTPNWMVTDSNVTGNEAFKTFISKYREKHEVTVGVGAIVCLYENLLAVKAAYEATDSDDAAGLAKALEGIGPTGIPDSIAKYWVGPDGLGASPEHHGNMAWDADDFTFVPAQDAKDGMVSPQV
ncbi:ABC transporter substrate-binding protein [Nonomuraea wenchangensis]|uniref:ABC transporter substrate-binding protein n=1 Tax=Nonomuraea wenchangensis TaxID=568860 RepID=UPI00341D17EF